MAQWDQAGRSRGNHPDPSWVCLFKPPAPSGQLRQCDFSPKHNNTHCPSREDSFGGLVRRVDNGASGRARQLRLLLLLGIPEPWLAEKGKPAVQRAYPHYQELCAQGEESHVCHHENLGPRDGVGTDSSGPRVQVQRGRYGFQSGLTLGKRGF